MSVVRRIFAEVADGSTLRAVKISLEKEGIPTPGGKKFWTQTYLKTLIEADVYKPHGRDELDGMVLPHVSARLDPDTFYGVWWYGREDTETYHEGGKKKKRVTRKPREEWVTVPVPDAGVPPEVVERARRRVSVGGKPSKAGDREWELDNGALFCGSCGRAMMPRGLRKGQTRYYYYYVCWAVHKHGKEACPNNRVFRARELEDLVANGVQAELLVDRQTLEARIDEALARDMPLDPSVGIETCLKTIEECQRKRRKNQEMYYTDAMTLAELKASNAELEEARQDAERTLKRLEEGERRADELLERKRAVLEAYGAGMMAWGVPTFPPRLKRLVYSLLGLRVAVHREDPGGRDVFFRDGAKGPFVVLECDFGASAIAHTREVEEYVAKMKELEREWEEGAPPDEDYVEGPDEFMHRKLSEWSLHTVNDKCES